MLVEDSRQRNCGLEKALLGPPWEREDSLTILGWASLSPRGTRLEDRTREALATRQPTPPPVGLTPVTGPLTHLGVIPGLHRLVHQEASCGLSWVLPEEVRGARTVSLGSFWHPRPPAFACLGGPKPEVSVPPPAQKRLEKARRPWLESGAVQSSAQAAEALPSGSST